MFRNVELTAEIEDLVAERNSFRDQRDQLLRIHTAKTDELARETETVVRFMDDAVEQRIQSSSDDEDFELAEESDNKNSINHDNIKAPQFTPEILVYDPENKVFVSKVASSVSTTKNSNIFKLTNTCMAHLAKPADGALTQRVKIEITSHKGHFIDANDEQCAEWVKTLGAFDRELKCRYFSFADYDADDAKVAIAKFGKAKK